MPTGVFKDPPNAEVVIDLKAIPELSVVKVSWCKYTHSLSTMCYFLVEVHMCSEYPPLLCEAVVKCFFLVGHAHCFDRGWVCHSLSTGTSSQ